MRTARSHFARALGALALAATALGVLAAAPAGADPADGRDDPANPPRTVLWLSAGGRSAALTCEPAGGTHPDPVAACRDLAIAGGDFANLPGDPLIGACPMVYDPVTASAVGLWRGEPVEFRATYSNACVLRARTGHVFQLVGLGPNPGG